MALQKTITLTDNFDIDVVITDCYMKVSEIKGNKNVIAFNVDYLNSSGTVIKRKRFTMTPSVSANSDNFIAQAYQHLKSLSEFNDAQDI